MTLTEIEPIEVTKESTDDGLGHEVCCLDENRAVCGIGRIEAPADDAEINCVVCIDLLKVGLVHRITRGHVHCPLNFQQICPIDKEDQ